MMTPKFTFILICHLKQATTKFTKVKAISKMSRETLKSSLLSLWKNLLSYQKRVFGEIILFPPFFMASLDAFFL